MSVPKPTPRPVSNPLFDAVMADTKFVEELKALGEAVHDKKSTPKPSAPRRERSAPVRNPAFREHEGLKELQKQLNSNGRKG